MAQSIGRFGFSNFHLEKTEANALGKGTYGIVYRAKCDKLICAAKVLSCQIRDSARFQQEIHFLSNIKHPNIIQYLGSCPDKESGSPILIMELMDKNLTSLLEWPALFKNNPPSLPLQVQVDIAHDVAQALSYLHNNGVLHRDLSSNNVLLIGSNRAKVADFGMARLLRTDTPFIMTPCPGTIYYMPPEALTYPSTYSNKLDVFSFGVLLVQLVTRRPPSPGPRMCRVQTTNSSTVPFFCAVPEVHRRSEHLNLVPPLHPFRMIALQCIADTERERPTADELCDALLALKGNENFHQAYTRRWMV